MAAVVSSEFFLSFSSNGDRQSALSRPDLTCIAEHVFFVQLNDKWSYYDPLLRWFTTDIYPFGDLLLIFTHSVIYDWYLPIRSFTTDIYPFGDLLLIFTHSFRRSHNYLFIKQN